MNWGAKAKLLNRNYYHPDYQQITKLLLSAKHRNPHSNSLRHNSSDDSMLVTSPLIHFLLPR
ncbi:hypothetical protein, partial [Prevotella brunnea]|uniref:hypothetical protein n=1 Tax=Prevotella brunnea TaxID=2508867 RepID=UPI0019621FA8